MLDGMSFDAAAIAWITSAAAVLLSVLALFFIVVLWIKLAGLNKYRNMIRQSNANNLEQLIVELQHRIVGQEATIEKHGRSIENINGKLKTMKANLGVYRYNAFPEQGSDLSFSIALLDDEQDGVVLTGLHGREESYFYAKPIVKGASSYPLTPEEKEAISRSLKSGCGSGC